MPVPFLLAVLLTAVAVLAVSLSVSVSVFRPVGRGPRRQQPALGPNADR